MIYADGERSRHEAASWHRAARRYPTRRWTGPSPISPLSLACTLTSRAVGRRDGLSCMVGRFRPTVRRTTEPGHTLPLRPGRPAPAQPRGPRRASSRVVDGSPCGRAPPERRGPAPGRCGTGATPGSACAGRAAGAAGGGGAAPARPQVRKTHGRTGGIAPRAPGSACAGRAAGWVEWWVVFVEGRDEDGPPFNHPHGFPQPSAIRRRGRRPRRYLRRIRESS